jgi:hypothetical protein
MHPLLPGVPDVESPFFRQLFSRPGLDAETRRIAFSLATQGYAVFDFPDPDLALKAESIKTDLQARFDLDQWRAHGHGARAGLRLRDAWSWQAQVRELACNARILELLGTLYGRRASPFQTLNFPVGTQQHVHSDVVHFHSSPERFMCAVWVALEDIDDDNGPLMYYPGSHRWPVYGNDHLGRCAAEMDAATTQAMYEPMWRALIEAHGVAPHTLRAKKGQALIWAANLLHGGAPQADPERTRWSQVTHYFFEDCAYFVPMLSDPMYGSIAWRRLVDIATGQPMPQRHLGLPIPEPFLKATVPLQLRWLDGFNGAQYLLANPDVAAAGMDPAEHYRLHGRAEKRKLRPD